MWIAVTSHAGHMAEISQSAGLQDLDNVLFDIQLFQYIQISSTISLNPIRLAIFRVAVFIDIAHL